MAVAKVYHHSAPASEVTFVVKAMVRLLRSHRFDQFYIIYIYIYIYLLWLGGWGWGLVGMERK